MKWTPTLAKEKKENQKRTLLSALDALGIRCLSSSFCIGKGQGQQALAGSERGCRSICERAIKLERQNNGTMKNVRGRCRKCPEVPAQSSGDSSWTARICAGCSPGPSAQWRKRPATRSGAPQRHSCTPHSEGCVPHWRARPPSPSPSS